MTEISGEIVEAIAEDCPTLKWAERGYFGDKWQEAESVLGTFEIHNFDNAEHWFLKLPWQKRMEQLSTLSAAKSRADYENASRLLMGLGL